MTMTRRAALMATAFAAELPDISTVPADLKVPTTGGGDPEPGRRVRASIDAWRGTDVHHTIYLPTDWKAGRRYPLVCEYAGNGNYRNSYGDVSDGSVEGSKLGYGLSAGAGFVWLCLPYVDALEKRNQAIWWGDAEATTAYCRAAVRETCERFGADPKRVLLTGFSRGAIGCNYLGLRDDETAALWRAFLPYSNYDGVRETWPYPDADRASARGRLERLRGRPQFIVHEGSTEGTREYLVGTGVVAPFTFCPLGFRNHDDAWTLRDIPERRQAREWLQRNV
jgi:hypothetical protein